MWVGWVTPDYHQHDMNFDLSKVRAVTVTMGDEQGNVHSRCWGGVGTVGGGRSALGTWLGSFPPTLPPVFLFISLQWLLLCFSFFFFVNSFFISPSSVFTTSFLCLLFFAPLYSPPSKTPHQLLRILAPRSSGLVGVRGFSAQVCRWWWFGNGP